MLFGQAVVSPRLLKETFLEKPRLCLVALCTNKSHLWSEQTPNWGEAWRLLFSKSRGTNYNCFEGILRTPERKKSAPTKVKNGMECQKELTTSIAVAFHNSPFQASANHFSMFQGPFGGTNTTIRLADPLVKFHEECLKRLQLLVSTLAKVSYVL